MFTSCVQVKRLRTSETCLRTMNSKVALQLRLRLPSSPGESTWAAPSCGIHGLWKLHIHKLWCVWCRFQKCLCMAMYEVNFLLDGKVIYCHFNCVSFLPDWIICFIGLEKNVDISNHIFILPLPFLHCVTHLIVNFNKLLKLTSVASRGRQESTLLLPSSAVPSTTYHLNDKHFVYMTSHFAITSAQVLFEGSMCHVVYHALSSICSD